MTQLFQQSNDTCLAYTLAAICNLLSETGISSTTGILGSSLSPFTSIGISLSVQQQLFVLLRGSLKRAENLKLKRLVASSHLAMARFDLTVSYRTTVYNTGFFFLYCSFFFFFYTFLSPLSFFIGGHCYCSSFPHNCVSNVFLWHGSPLQVYVVAAFLCYYLY